jgi:AcrR family transcriptional regulator
MRSENKRASQDRTFVEAARREQIVRSAIDTIAEMGYAKASLAQIAERTGISKGVISYHFAGKDDLIAQVASDIAAAAAAFTTPRILAQRKPVAMLRMYIEANLDFMKTHRTSVIAQTGILMHQQPDRAKGEPAELEGNVATLQQLLQLGQQAQAFRDFDTASMARTIRAAVDAVAARLAAAPDLDLDAYAAELATTFELATRR